VGTLGSAILQGLGHPEWIAQTEAQYLQIALDLAADLPKLAEIRAGLRTHMEHSARMDEAGFARRAETAYRGMFGRWVATNDQAQ
jgi:predicted O-linked N-acetylglucosamine transferase (SPINDLY family)